jgi:hypothetical protein
MLHFVWGPCSKWDEVPTELDLGFETTMGSVRCSLWWCFVPHHTAAFPSFHEASACMYMHDGQCAPRSKTPSRLGLTPNDASANRCKLLCKLGVLDLAGLSPHTIHARVQPCFTWGSPRPLAMIVRCCDLPCAHSDAARSACIQLPRCCSQVARCVNPSCSAGTPCQRCRHGSWFEMFWSAPRAYTSPWCQLISAPMPPRCPFRAPLKTL